MQFFKLFKTYILRYKLLIGLACVCVTITNIIALVPPWIIGEAVGIFTMFGGEENPALKEDAISQTLNLAILFLCTGIALAVFRFMWRRLAFDASRYIEFDLREEFLSHLLKLSPRFFDSAKVGDLISRASYDIEMIRLFLSVGLIIAVDVFAIEAVTIPVLFSIDPTITIIIILPLPLIAFIATKLIAYLAKTSRAVQDHNAVLSAEVQELYSGARVIKAYNREEDVTGKFRKTSGDNVSVNIKFAFARSYFLAMIMSSAIILQLIFMYFGGSALLGGSLTMANFIKFNLYLIWIVMPMAYLGWGINLYHRGKASMERLQEILRVKPEIYDEPTVDASINEIKGDIELRNLSFSYDDSEILSNINITINRGETVAIVGRTGSGKSTLVHLLARLYNPPKDSVFIDGHDIFEIPLSVLRKSIGFVTQEPLLFSESIGENIAFGIPSLSQEKIEASARMAGVHEEILSFEKKYETMLGERGINISGGQKQRTTIARALAIDPTILILDDALASVDTKTEEIILSSMKEVRKGRTCLIISHRVSSVKDADKIIVLEKGRIAEFGTHDELIDSRGYYYDLYRKQQLTQELEDV